MAAAFKQERAPVVIIDETDSHSNSLLNIDDSPRNQDLMQSESENEYGDENPFFGGSDCQALKLLE